MASLSGRSGYGAVHVPSRRAVPFGELRIPRQGPQTEAIAPSLGTLEIRTGNAQATALTPFPVTHRPTAPAIPLRTRAKQTPQQRQATAAKGTRMNEDVIEALAALGNAVMKLSSIIEDTLDPNDARMAAIREHVQDAGSAIFRLTVAATKQPR
jgi:hypothetical protein